MGFSDIFNSTSDKPPLDSDSGKEEVFRKLTEELVRVREERKDAVNRLREMEDTLRLKEGILDTLERRIENLEQENHRLLSVETELVLLRQDQAEYPLSSSDALHRYDQLSTIFLSLRETLSCAVCYEPYLKDQAISLLCGHSFCQGCFSNWEQRHVEAWKLNPYEQGVYPGAECPECRSREVRRGKVRIWAMEETVRLVERAVREIEGNRFTPAKKNVERVVTEDTRVSSAETKLEKVGEERETGKAGTEPLNVDHEVRDEPEEEAQIATEVFDADRAPSPSPLDHDTLSMDMNPPPERADSLCEPSQDSPDLSPLLRPTSIRFEEPIPISSSSQSNPAHDLDSAHALEGESNPNLSFVQSPSTTSLPVSSTTEPISEPLTITEENQDVAMSDVVEASAEEVEEARNLLRPRTPNPYIAVFR
ncbi:hypothetical protein JCM16303_002208 [Sporobolomyces ruberrimus]